MRLTISENRAIRDVQYDFNTCYPFLKLEFYKLQDADSSLPVKKHLPHSLSLKAAGLKSGGMLELKNEMTVAELEKIFLKAFGLDVQVSRRSGALWLETTMTDSWSLQKQNDHGREISLGGGIPRFNAGGDGL
jgi:hypothetical protein